VKSIAIGNIWSHALRGGESMIENGLEMMVVYKKRDKPSRRPESGVGSAKHDWKASILMRIQK
jgi:hypothetical protein